MGSSLCKPTRKKIATSSWVPNENDNPFEKELTKKERQCLHETYKRLTDPKEIVGIIFVEIVSEICPEFKKVFGVDRAPKATMLKMPKMGGHAAQMANFLEQMTSMLGYTENLMGAWQLVRKTGRLHAKVQFLEVNQNQLEKNYFSVVVEVFIQEFIPYLTGEKEEPVPEGQAPTDKKKVRFAQSYSNVMITDVWKKFLTLCISQLTESFELERAKGLNSENQKTLAPHQHVEAAERKKRLNAEKQSEPETNTTNSNPREEMFEDPF